MKSSLGRIRPEDVGISPSVLLRYLDAMTQIGFIAHHIMILKNGHIAFEINFAPFRADVPHYICSCSKSVAATAVGFALDEGLVALNDRIVDIFPEKLSGQPHPYIAALTVKHLLTMCTVSDDDRFTPTTKDWTRDYLNAQPLHYPGTVFGYDSTGTHILCEMVQKLCGTTVHEYLKPRLFVPLSIDETQVRWQVNPMGINHGGGGCHFTPEAMAKFGLLYLQNGMWMGKQVLPHGWAQEVAKPHICSASRDGTSKGEYGYKFWRVQNNGFACLGFAGQSIVMHPDKDVVFVGAANGLQTDYHYFHMTLFWELVYPHIASEAIPYEDAAYAQLQECVRDAQVFLPGSSCVGQHSPVIAGLTRNLARSRVKPGMTESLYEQPFPADTNKLNCTGFKFDFGNDGGILTLFLPEREIAIPFGYGKHLPGDIGLLSYAVSNHVDETFPNGCAAAGRWVNDRTLVIQSHAVDTLHYFLITCHFGDAVTVIEIRPYGRYQFDVFPCSITSITRRII